MADDLVAEQTRVEREIAALTSSLGEANVLLGALRNHPPKPRGLVPGLLLGALVFAMMLGVSLLWVMSTIGRMD